MRKETFEFRSRMFSWDSDHYKEYEEIKIFDTLEQLNLFCKSFNSLPEPDYKMPYFGKFKDIEDYNRLLETLGKGSGWYNSGGVSIEFFKFYKIVEESEIN